ncbi:MAG: hypothetical protein H0U43_00185, partial [Chthoniobacterales bacterium]|nr:hypothetical protein [Chthoniobacterales bacterium]
MECVDSAAAAPLERSVSSSRQFIVYGPDRGLRAGICDLGERTKKNMLAVLQQRDGWRTPIVVNAERRAANLPEAPLAHLRFSQTGFGLKLQLELTFDAESKPDAIERELLRVLLLEMMYRDVPDTPAGTAYMQPPDWLIDGILAVAPDHDFSRMAESVAALPEESKRLQLAEFLQLQPALLESPSRAVYAAKAGALVSMLTALPDGRARLSRFIQHLPTASNDAVADLRSQFSEVARSDEEVQQSWGRALGALSDRDRYRMMTCDETEQALMETLVVRLQTGGNVETYALEEFPTFIHSAGAVRELQMLEERLLVISGRANPLYAVIIAEYRRITAALVRRKTNKIAERLARVRGDREQITRLMSSIADYMNWFEATQVHAQSGAFVE